MAAVGPWPRPADLVVVGRSGAHRLSKPRDRHRPTRGYSPAAGLATAGAARAACAWGRPSASGRLSAASLWLVPAGVSATAPVLLYLHGGGFTGGSAGTHAPWAARLAKAAQCRVLLPDYRLAPEHPFPAQHDDALAIWAWLVAQHGGRAHQLAVAGDSAGGNMAATLLWRAPAAGLPAPAAAVLLCPWVDVAPFADTPANRAAFDWPERAHFANWRQGWLGDRAVAGLPDPALASPLCLDSLRLAACAPCLVLVGGAEMLVEQVRAFVANANAAGAPMALEVVPDMVHDWFALDAVLAQARGVEHTVAPFLRARWGGDCS